MKLELEKLAPYLPYGIKMKYCIENGSIWQLDISNINAITEYDKPILRPLSDLFKLIDWDNNNDPYMVGYKYNISTLKEYNKISYVEEHYADYCSNPKSYVDITSFNWWLFEYHFDVYGLIEQGLAIDINTI